MQFHPPINKFLSLRRSLLVPAGVVALLACATMLFSSDEAQPADTSGVPGGEPSSVAQDPAGSESQLDASTRGTEPEAPAPQALPEPQAVAAQAGRAESNRGGVTYPASDGFWGRSGEQEFAGDDAFVQQVQAMFDRPQEFAPQPQQSWEDQAYWAAVQAREEAERSFMNDIAGDMAIMTGYY